VIVHHLAFEANEMFDGKLNERINHAQEFADEKITSNSLRISGANFWSQVKRILRKYNFINRQSFLLFLKECEFRFNYGTARQKIKTLRK